MQKLSLDMDVELSSLHISIQGHTRKTGILIHCDRNLITYIYVLSIIVCIYKRYGETHF